MFDTATVTAWPPACCVAVILPAQSISDMIQPPKTCPIRLVSVGIARVREASSPRGWAAGWSRACFLGRSLRLSANRAFSFAGRMTCTSRQRWRVPPGFGGLSEHVAMQHEDVNQRKYRDVFILRCTKSSRRQALEIPALRSALPPNWALATLSLQPAYGQIRPLRQGDPS